MDQKPATPPAEPAPAAPPDPKALETPPAMGAQPSEPDAADKPKEPAKKQLSGPKKLLKRFNVYLLIFILFVLIAAVVTVVGYLNGKKPPTTPALIAQELNQNALSQLASSDSTVGSSGKTLTVQGNTILSGSTLVKGDLGVSGTIQAGTGIVVPQITVSGTSNLGATQINTLQVAQATTMQGALTLQADLNVAGTAAFNGPVTIGRLVVTQLVMNGNASLTIPNHISFPGASPGRTVNPTVLGAGGSSSISGSDTSGTISINTGSGTVAGCFANITFNVKFTSTPHVLVSPVGVAAGQTQYYVDRNTNGFSVCTANAAPANQAFAYDYFITQ